MVDEQKSISKSFLDKFKEFVQNPWEAEFSFINNEELLEVTQALDLKYLTAFWTKFPSANSFNKINEVILNNLNLWEIFEPSELINLNELLIKYQIKDETIKKDLFNSLAIYLIYADFYFIQKNALFLKIKKNLEYLNILKKRQKSERIIFRGFKTFNSLISKSNELLELEKYPIIFELNNYLNFPARKPINPATNFLIAKITDAGINSGIKDHFADCTKPMVKELKELFPKYLKEITSENTDYFSTKVRLGRKLYRENFLLPTACVASPN